jgi:hypothetical protein
MFITSDTQQPARPGHLADSPRNHRSGESPARSPNPRPQIASFTTATPRFNPTSASELLNSRANGVNLRQSPGRT